MVSTAKAPSTIPLNEAQLQANEIEHLSVAEESESRNISTNTGELI